MASPLVIAHRGDSFNAPENTLAAFQMAADAGADGVEFDVQLSKDGIPVVIHDGSLKRTGDRPEKVADLTADELAEVDVGSWFNRKNPEKKLSKFAGETVPTLARVLGLLEAARGLIYVELKCGDRNHELLARTVCDVIRDSDQLPRIIIKSFKLGAIPIVRYCLPDVQTAALFEPNIMNILRHRRQMISIAREFGAHQISIHTSLATQKLADLASEARMPVTIWTADRPKWIERCRRIGVGALITNDPAKLLAVRDGQ